MYEALRNKKDFDQVYKRGRIFGNRNFTFRCLKNNLEYNRIGIVVSKRVSNKAVVRNKLRRQMKAYLHDNNSDHEQGYDIIITAKAKCVGQEYKSLSKALDHLFKQSKLKKK